MLVLMLFAIAAAQAVTPQPPTGLTATVMTRQKTDCKTLVAEIWKETGVDRPFEQPPEEHQLGDACQPFSIGVPKRDTPQQDRERED